MIKYFVRCVKNKIVDFCYDVKTIFKLMGANLKENIIWCNN